MKNSMIKIEIVTEKINHFFSNEKHTIDGAEVIFNGRVRNFEKGKKIIALGGVSKKNLKLLNLTNCYGFAGISYFK